MEKSCCYRSEETGIGALLRRLGLGRHMQPVNPQPMQQYVFLPMIKPLVVDQRDFLSLQVGQFFILYCTT
jgi:hypothetical protein